MDREAELAQNAAVFAGGGELGALMRAHQWSATALGVSQAWPQSLKTLLVVMLSAKQPMFIVWGEERTLLYNDAYAEILAAKHPTALGRDFLEVWHEIRADLTPIVDDAYAGRSVHMDDIKLMMDRRGFLEETHFAFSYTPMPDEAGAIAGFFCPCREITEQVLAERRQAFRLGFEVRLRDLEDAEEILQAAVDLLGEHLGADRVGYGQVQADESSIRLTHCYAPGTQLLLGEFPLASFGDGRIAKQRRGETEVCADVTTDGGQDASVWAAIDTRAVVSVPLLRDGRLRASLYVNSRHPRLWSAEDVALIEEVAARTWDAVERGRAEAALRESEVRYRTLFENIDSGFCVVEVDLSHPTRQVDYRVAEANPAFFRQTGFPKEIYGKWLREAAPTLEEHWFEIYGQVARTRTPERFEQGSAHLGRWFDVYAFPIGEPEDARVAILFNDISERRRAEQKLRSNLQQMPGFVAVLSGEDHVFEYVNDAYTSVTGNREYIGRNVRDVFPDLEGQGFFELLDDVFATGESFSASTIAVRFGGHSEDRYLDLLYQPIFDSGVVTGIFVGGYEVTERLRAEQALQALTTRLEQTVEERTAGLTAALDALRKEAEDRQRVEEALRQSQKMEAMGQLTGGVAHDFNNLLMPIIGSLDMLMRRELGTERERRLIDGALQSAERAKTLVQRLLAFARRQPLQSAAIDVMQLVKSMADLVDSTTGPQIEVRVDLPENLPAALADPNQLEMAILNLAVNARDAMPQGGVLRIQARQEDVRAGDYPGVPAGKFIRLCVSDNGTGMDEATLARAIEPFYSTKGVGRGTGLGLSMVHGLAAQLGGGLTIESTLGEGTTVNLWLPLTTNRPSPVNPSEESSNSRVALGAALLVDDEELVRMTTADMLTDLGFEVIEANSGEEALRLLEEGLRPNLLVTDHLMPGVTGAELARKVQADWPGLPILIVSGYAEAEGLESDLVGLTKPFRNGELAAKLVALGALTST
ncbi:PAS domain-containing protein [Phenylobacterium sp.]|jgi:signal transduction histidine kinase/CheY-like chemotaxis protein|uniref:PAS domain-containing protein n=1 Tax=Phenylobacterium sp. TaxID=1871053 RepID=UPI000C8B58FD|nr:PAS domain-containing protein [Phenylobacterium sp.]MAK82109.1 hybrid sensor histidine kinase/response regulator [Phenylobacterium sp.]|tara:strand:+ start:1600 stop:4560 length:2961 start_codon:yes stop_codon:yes gene_type:complete